MKSRYFRAGSYSLRGDQPPPVGRVTVDPCLFAPADGRNARPLPAGLLSQALAPKHRRFVRRAPKIYIAPQFTANYQFLK